MSNNREIRVPAKSVHILMGIMRESKGSNNKNCIRQVVKDYNLDLAVLESKLKVMGGNWRIYKTVNERDVEKARIWLLHRLIDFPDHAGYVDSEWRTALLQTDHIYGEKKFMLDIDTQDEDKVKVVEDIIGNLWLKQEVEGLPGAKRTPYIILDRIKSPKGWHYITRHFDTREICKLDYVTLLRDGYHYVKTVIPESKQCFCCSISCQSGCKCEKYEN